MNFEHFYEKIHFFSMINLNQIYIGLYYFMEKNKWMNEFIGIYDS